MYLLNLKEKLVLKDKSKQMINIVGDKETFAVEFEILKLGNGFDSHLRIWINNTSLGDFSETTYFVHLLGCINSICRKPKNLWFEEFNGLSCNDIFYKIIPCYNNPESFFNLSQGEMDALVKYDRFLFNWGDAFNDWYLKVVVNEDICKFLWVHTPLGDEDSFAVRNDIKCFDVELKILKEVNKQLSKFIPDELWPKLITR